MTVQFGSTPTPSAKVKELAPVGDTVASQGLRNGLLSTGAGLTALAGTALQSYGDAQANRGGHPEEYDPIVDPRKLAQGLYGTSRSLRERAAANPLDIQSISQVHGVDDALRYGVGLATQSAPAMAAGIGGALATRGRMPLLGATLATVPFTAGDLASRQQEDPVIAAQPAGKRLTHALGVGALTAAAQNVVPVAMGGKLLGRGISQAGMSMGRNVAMNLGEAVVGNAAAGVGSEYANQTSLTALNANRDTSGDRQGLIDAGAGGAVMGVPFAGAGVLGHALHGKGLAPRTDGVAVPEAGARPDAAAGAPAAPGPEPVAQTPSPSLADRFKNVFKKDPAATDAESAQNITAGKEDGIDLGTLKRAGPEEQGDMLKQADESRANKVKDWASKMYEDANLSPEHRAKIDEFMANPADRASQAAVAGMKVAQDAASTASVKVKEFTDFAKSKFGGKPDDAVKLSTMDSPKLVSKIADTIAPALSQHWPDVVQNENHLNVVSKTMTGFLHEMQTTGKLDADSIEQLHGWFKDDAPSVLASLHSAVLDSGDKAGTEKFFGALNDMTDNLAHTKSLEGQVQAAWPDGVKPTPAAVREVVKGLRDHMDGTDAKGRTSAESEFHTKQVDDTLRAHFGDKADGLIKAAEKDAQRRSKATKESLVEDTNDSMSERSVAEEVDSKYSKVLRDPDAHRAEFGNEGQAERLMKEARVKNPDAMVDFVKVKDLPDAERAKYPNAKPDEGVVVVEGTRDETRITDEEMKSFTIDTHGKTSHAYNNASRVDTGVKGAVIDARALVKAMKRKLDYTASDDHGNRNRTARAFMEGIAGVQDRLGKTFDIPDTTVIEPGFTYGDAKKLTMRKPDPAWMKGKTDEEINKSLAREETLKDMSDRELEKATVKAQEIAERREAAFKEKVKGQKLDKASYRELRKSMGVEEAKDAVNAAEREAAKRVEDTHKTKTLEDEGRSEVDPNENITRVGDSEPRRAGFDDNPLAYDNFIRPNADGSIPKAMRNGIESKISKLENLKTSGGTKNMIAAAVAVKARALLDKFDSLKKTDQVMLVSIAKDNSVSSIAAVVNDLHDKYPAEALVAQRKTDAWIAQRKALESVPTKTLESEVAAWEKSERIARDAYDPDSDGNATRFGEMPEDIADMAWELKRRAPPKPTKPPRKLAAWEIKHNAREAKLEGQIATGKANAASKKPSAFVEKVLGKGDLAPVMKSIDTSKDPVALRRVVDALGEHLDNSRAREVLDKANERITKLIEADPTIAYSFQRTDPNAVHDAATQGDVRAHIDKVLGGKVDVEFAKLLHAGEFKPGNGAKPDLIRLSVHAMDPMGTAFHESLHAFVSQLRDGGMMDAAHPLMKAADSLYVKNRLRALLKDHPDALKQIDKSLEERAAYMYQFWAKGDLVLPTKPTTVLGHIKQAILKVMGMWTNDQRAQHIMEYFNSGEYAKQAGDAKAVRLSLDQGTNERIQAFKEVAKPLMRLADAVAATGDSRLRSSMIPALMELADSVYSPLQGATEDPGYVPAARMKSSKVLNDIAEKLGQYDAAAVTDALESMQRGVKGTTPEERQVMIHVRKMLDGMFDYMNEAGVKVNDLGYKNGYFPRVWDASTILNKETEFRAMLQKYKDDGKFAGDIDDVIAKLSRADGSELQIETIKPGMQHTKERILGFITGDDAAPFLQKDMHMTLNSYITQAARRAEWSRRFSDDGSKLTALMERAKEEGATPEDLDAAADYLQGVDGTLGDKINPKLRRAFGNMIVYQNIRLLPLMIFSSFVDPGGILVRGGTMGEAFNAMKRGFSEIPKGFKDKIGTDEWTQLAETMGVIESSVLMKAMGTSYSQGMTSNFGRKVNDTFFKYNLMAQYNTSMRVGATEAAVGFLGRHADGTGSVHSARWLAELGFKPGEVVVKNGRPLLTEAEFKAHGMSADAAKAMGDRMTLAVNKWVDGAILRPNAAHKPVWMNDPHFALFGHLKQFMYAFQETILKRVINEARHGNIAPAYALAGYVPVMIAADMMKSMIVGGGSMQSQKEGWGLEDWLESGLQRAGLLGVAQIGVDVAKDVHRGSTGLGTLLGPAVGQLGDAVSVAAGPEQFKTFAMNSLPANQVFDAAAAAVD